jgi:hypothetical protein
MVFGISSKLVNLFLLPVTFICPSSTGVIACKVILTSAYLAVLGLFGLRQSASVAVELVVVLLTCDW